MPLRIIVKHLLSVGVFLSAAAGSALAATTPTPVDIRCSGDDGLTQRVCSAIEDKFRVSTDFELNSEGKSGTLVINIPTNVRWEQVGKKMKVIYTVQFATWENKTIANYKGTCWDGKIIKCADQVLRDAIAVKHRTERSP